MEAEAVVVPATYPDSAVFVKCIIAQEKASVLETDCGPACFPCPFGHSASICTGLADFHHTAGERPWRAH